MSNEHLPDLERQVGNLYLLLHRENYLNEPGDIRDTVQRLCTRLSHDQILDLLLQADWRPRIVGIYCVLGARRQGLEEHLRAELTCGGFRALRRPACLALLVMNAPALAAELKTLLDLPFDPEDTDARAAALEALGMLGDLQHKEYATRTQHALRQALLPESGFEESRRRFAAAVQIWR